MCCDTILFMVSGMKTKQKSHKVMEWIKSKTIPPCKCGHRSTGYNKKQFDPKKVYEGTQIEYEHTCNPDLAATIAMDHISEMGYGYYPELEKLESKLLKQNKGKEYMKDKRKPPKKCKK